MSQPSTSSPPMLQVNYMGHKLTIPLSNELLSFTDLYTFVGFFYFPNARRYHLVLHGRCNGSLVKIEKDNWNREFVQRLLSEGRGYILAQFYSVQLHLPPHLIGQNIPSASTNGSFQVRLHQSQSMPMNAPTNTHAHPRRSTMEMAHARTSQSPLAPAQMMGSSRVFNSALASIDAADTSNSDNSPLARPGNLLQRPDSVNACVSANQGASEQSDTVVARLTSPGHSESLQQLTTGKIPPESASCPKIAAGETSTIQYTSRLALDSALDPLHQQPASQSEASKTSNIPSVVQTKPNSNVPLSQLLSSWRGLPHQSKNKDKDVVEPHTNPILATSQENAPETASPVLTSHTRVRDENTPAVPHEKASASARAAATRKNIVDLTATTQEESEDDEPPSKRRGTRTNSVKTTSKADQISITFLFDCRTKNFVPLEQGWKGFTLRFPFDTDYKKIDDSIWSRLELQLADTPLSTQEQKDHVSFDIYIDGRSMQVGDKLKDFIADAIDCTNQSIAGKRKRSESDCSRNRAFGTVRLWLGPKDKSEEKFKFDTYADYEHVKHRKNLLAGNEDGAGKAV